MAAEVGAGFLDGCELGVAAGEVMEGGLKAFLGLVAGEPVVFPHAVEEAEGFGGHEGFLPGEGLVGLGDEAVEREVAPGFPAEGEEVVVEDVDDDAGEAPPLRGEEGAGGGEGGVGVGEGVHGAVHDDALDDAGGQVGRAGIRGCL